MPRLFIPLTLMFCAGAAGAELPDSMAASRQCLVVTVNSWSAPEGSMSIFERDKGSKWQRHGPPIAIVVGKTGLAWGRGIADAAGLEGPIKKEGDRKAPAGIFRLSKVFGYAPAAETKMPYLALSPNVVDVDDPQSRYYNRLIDQSKIEKRDWRTAEVMFRKDDLYKWGVIVDHNASAQPGAGSCIFLHVWRGPHKPTVGCTAMAEQNLLEIIRWLDPAKHPLLVQLPRPIFNQRRAEWNLPMLR